jgi:regulator of replication initiation timing
MSLFWGNFMKDRERSRGASHSEQADRIQDSIPLVSSTHASTRNDERVSMSPRAEAEVIFRKQHSTQTQPATPEREASSVDLREFRRLKNEVLTLTKKVDSLTQERNDFREENSQLRESLKELRELKEKEDHRREQKRKAQARYREKNRDKYYDYHKTYMQEYRANRRDQEPKPEADIDNSKRSSN